MSFDESCHTLESILAGGTRKAVLSHALRGKSFTKSLTRLRDGMVAHRFETGGAPVELADWVERLDHADRKDGFHVLTDWDGRAARFNDDTIPVEVANFMFDRERSGDDAVALAILLDYYFLYMIGLLSLRVWDDDCADAHFDRVTALLRTLQGPEGSGQRFVDDAETLISVMTAHFEPEDAAYDRMYEKVQRQEGHHRMNMAFVSASLLSCHLRFGFEATYGRDIVEMRNDNVADYPWLCFALTTLIEAYEKLTVEKDESMLRGRVVEAIANGLSPDPRAFVGKPPACLADYSAEHTRFRETFLRHKASLLEEIESHRPSESFYSPLSFAFNFSHNTLKAIVVDAVLRSEPWDLSLNDLFSGLPRHADQSGPKEALARVLTDYGHQSPDRFRGRLVPVIFYDPRVGRRFFKQTLERLRK